MPAVSTCGGSGTHKKRAGGFSQSYDRAANTQAAKDFNELRNWITGEGPPETVADFDFDRLRLREITPKQQSVYKALMALILCHGAQDFHHGHALTAASITSQTVDDHHVFPRAHVNPPTEEQRFPWQLVDCILNRTLIDSNTNQSIGKRPPFEYLEDVRAELDAVAGQTARRAAELPDLRNSHRAKR